MQTDFSKNNHILFFVGILPGISMLSAWIFSKAFPNLPFWVETLSPLTAYGFFFWLFDNYLWSWRLFRIFKIVDMPDLRGRWKGVLLSSYTKNGQRVKVPACLEIKQSFSSIVVRAYYKKSQSESVAADFKKLNDEVYLFYTYDNDPNTLKEGTMQSHKGTAKIQYLPKEKVLKGFYFNSIGNNGDISLKYDGSALVCHF